MNTNGVIVIALGAALQGRNVLLMFLKEETAKDAFNRCVDIVRAYKLSPTAFKQSAVQREIKFSTGGRIEFVPHTRPERRLGSMAREVFEERRPYTFEV